jgi:hypothetical protein
MATNRSMIEKSLVPGVHEMVGLSYGATPEEHKPLYEILNSQRSFEEEVYVSGMGGALLKPEGTAVQFDDIQETYTSRYQHETVAIGFAVTKEAFDDDLYDTIARAKAQELGRAMADTKQVKAAATFNNAFNAAFPGGDGVPLIDPAHPTSIGTFSNTLGAVPLSEVALEDAHVAISKLETDRGILLALRPVSLHIPPELQWTAEKITNSTLTTVNATFGTDGITNQNSVNAVKSLGTYPGGMYINHRFTSPTNWFIKTSATNGTKMFVREALSGDTDTDFVTDNMLFKFRERYSFGWTDPRAWYGSGS